MTRGSHLCTLCTTVWLFVGGCAFGQGGPGGIAISGPSPWIDPTSPVYGAICNGSANDTGAFQSALNALTLVGEQGSADPVVGSAALWLGKNRRPKTAVFATPRSSLRGPRGRALGPPSLHVADHIAAEQHREDRP